MNASLPVLLQSVYVIVLIHLSLEFNSHTKLVYHAPSLLSSADVILALLPTTILLISTQKFLHVTVVSRISASASVGSTLEKSFSVEKLYPM